jgi:hypothetical protein
VFNKPDNLAALALILSIPGSVLIHEGQMEGKREKLPVQRIKPLTQEAPDVQLRESYMQLLKVTADDVFKKGNFQLFDPGIYGALGFIRKDERRLIAFLAQISEAWHRFNAPAMNISAVANEAGAQPVLRVTNLLNSAAATIGRSNGEFHLEMSRVGVDDETKFCLLEASPL